MNILITGNLSSLATTLAKEIAKRKNRVVLASDDADRLGIKSKNIIVRSINPATGLFRDAMSSYGFDIIIYLSTREEQLSDEEDFMAGHQLDGLQSTLELCKHENLKHFFYISSSEVYGNAQNPAEEADPQPASTNGHTLLTGEQYCQIYHEKFGVKTTIVRLTNIYGPDERSGLLYRLLMAYHANGGLDFPGQESSEISLLHTLDVADFLIRAIDEEYTPEAQIVNLSSSSPTTYSALARLLQRYLPDATFKFSEDSARYTRPVEGSVARRIYSWTDTHAIDAELESMVEVSRGEPLPKKSDLQAITRRLSNYPSILKWIELILGTALTQFLSQMTGTLIQFKYVDFRLLFVVVMGSVYGIRMGLYASILVSISILYTWMQLGFDWALLIYNVGNWLPFTLYFAAGLITGYTHDRVENQLLNAKKQTDLMYEKYSFLFGVFNDIRELKDEFRERLIGYRDSFGKIFTITRELDQLQEQAVFLRAVGILEEYIDNKSIAIYSLDGNRTHARLEANSASLNEKLAKSLKLSDFPEILPHIEQGTIYRNTALTPNSPAYVVPILSNTYPFNVPTAMIAVWSAKFEQYSTYYLNLLKVICGLIQASLVRATMFSNANSERMYLPSTRILNHEPFMDVLRIRAEMKKNRLSDFQLLVLEGFENNVQDIYRGISEGIRASDIIGRGKDGNYFVLLPQADELAAREVVERLAGLGIQSQLVDGHEIPVE